MHHRLVFVSLTVLSLLLVSSASLVFVPTFANSPSSASSVASPSFNQFTGGKISNTGKVELTKTTVVPLNSISASPANYSTDGNVTHVISRERPQVTASIASHVPAVSVDSVVNNSGAAATTKGVNSYQNQVVNG